MNSKLNVFITGASSGIGEATAILLAKSGLAGKIWLAARREERLTALAKKIASFNVETVCVQLDVRNEKALADYVAEHPELSQLDVLINNAGLALGLSTIQAGEISDWDQMIDTNVKGLLYCTRHILPFFVKKKSGHIINIGSVAGHTVYPNGAVYCASKHAVKALNEAMRIDTIGHNIRVTSIDPGMLETEFSLVRFKGDAEKAKSVYKGVRPLQPQDIAETIAWCLSRPAHVNIQEVLIMPTDQASVRDVHRMEK